MNFYHVMRKKFIPKYFCFFSGKMVEQSGSMPSRFTEEEFEGVMKYLGTMIIWTFHKLTGILPLSAVP